MSKITHFLIFLNFRFLDNARQKLWQKLGNPAGLNTILNILFRSNIIRTNSPSPCINVEVVAHPQTNTSRTALK